MDSKCFFALCCILLFSFPTEIQATRPITTMSEMAIGLHSDSQIKKLLPSYRAFSTQKNIGRRELVESLELHAKGSKPVVAATLYELPPTYTDPGIHH
uniref:Uncharacterized protein n=1 Tax=Tanacetum cinerariifolium TaxID=118510 RepID=A0A6L2NVK5_TANCI|nr:hypothetical protein [Tanacetum cinerariifolium]